MKRPLHFRSKKFSTCNRECRVLISTYIFCLLRVQINICAFIFPCCYKHMSQISCHNMNKWAYRWDTLSRLVRFLVAVFLLCVSKLHPAIRLLLADHFCILLFGLQDYDASSQPFLIQFCLVMKAQWVYSHAILMIYSHSKMMCNPGENKVHVNQTQNSNL